MTPTQYRMARAALGWTTRQVAAAAGLPVSAVNVFEGGPGDPCRTMAAIRSTLQSRGVVFVEDDGFGAGVRFKDAEHAAVAPCRKLNGPATDAVERMEAEIAADRKKR